ncbi:phosphoribosylanthranilate isomerase [Campylobacter majalis]|uniref:phosphoribosylanthranilate isomerase n=1 Tax=Campylobacter majalis TaxID=2790656 RepID=UPI003D684CA7
MRDQKTLVKICGIKSLDEARAVLEVGVKFGSFKGGISNLDNKASVDFNNSQNLPLATTNAIGFIGVIFAKSKRQVNMQTAREISRIAHKYGVKCVGVFASSDTQSCNANSEKKDENLAQTSQGLASFSSYARNSKPLMSYAYGYETDEIEMIEYNSLNSNKPRQELALQNKNESEQKSKDEPLQNLATSKSSVSYGVQSDCEIMEICEYCELDVAQIHGFVSENLYANLKDLGLKVWKAQSIAQDADGLPRVSESCDMVLYDCKGESLGGNGTSFSWEILRDLKPFSFGMAGGIGEQNFAKALEFKPFLIDINSKVEDENLVKVPSKIERILKQIKIG